MPKRKRALLSKVEHLSPVGGTVADGGVKIVGAGVSGDSVVWDGLTLGAGVREPPVHGDSY